MRRILAFLSVLAVSFCVFIIPVSAKNNVSKMEIIAILKDDGSMVVSQTWQGEFNNGTECYIPIRKSGYIQLSDFRVYDDNGDFYLEQNWDINASIEKKSRKCGIIDKGTEYEVCWGIGDYGNNKYTIEYTLSGIVGSYTDSDGFNFRFVNPGMDVFPTNVIIAIGAESNIAITDENANIWAFGHEGQIEFYNDAIISYTTKPLEGNENVTVMVQLDKGVLHPSRSVNDTFGTTKDNAYEGSDYESSEEGNSRFVSIAVVCMVIVGILAIKLMFSTVRKSIIDRFVKKSGYFRDIPNGSNMCATYKLGECFDLCEEKNIIGTIMLRLINQGCISPIVENDVGIGGKQNKTVNMAFVNPPEDEKSYEHRLYVLIKKASGGDDILKCEEMERYYKDNPSVLRGFIDRCKGEGETAIYNMKCFKSTISRHLSRLTPQGEKELREIAGLKNYLTDFTLLSERGAEESFVWQDYMEYAMLMGIARQVIKDLKKIYPHDIPQLELYERNISLAYNYNTFIYFGMANAEAAARQARVSGSGGGASFGGGGGFSGGGFGGGTR